VDDLTLHSLQEGGRFLPLVQRNLRHALHRMRMKMNPRAVLEPSWRRRQELQPQVRQPRCFEHPRRRQGHASRQVFCACARQVQRSPLTSDCGVCHLPMHCAPRTRTRRPVGKTSNSSSRRIVPATSVPVTTVPKPFMVNTRSMGSRAIAFESRGCTSVAATTIARLSSSSPRPYTNLQQRSRLVCPTTSAAQKLFHLQPHHAERLRIHRVRTWSDTVMRRAARRAVAGCRNAPGSAA